MHLLVHVIALKLTFAGLHTLKPAVTSVSVDGTSAVLIPSTAGSATTDSTGFLKRTALWTRHFTGRGNDQCARADWCGDWRADY